MKKFKYLFLAFGAAVLLWSCEGPPGPIGPEGPRGPQGPQGPQTIALMYEIIFDLNGDNEWKALYSFPSEDEIYLEDVVLVYLLWDQIEIDGELTDVWRLMPVNFFTNDGMLSFVYDFTVLDVQISADAEFVLDPEVDVFEDYVARIVVVPAGYSPNARMNYQDYHSVAKALGLPDDPVKQGTPLLKSMQ